MYTWGMHARAPYLEQDECSKDGIGEPLGRRVAREHLGVDADARRGDDRQGAGVHPSR